MPGPSLRNINSFLILADDGRPKCGASPFTVVGMVLVAIVGMVVVRVVSVMVVVTVDRVNVLVHAAQQRST